MPMESCTQMNAVEIEQAITDLAEQPFDPIEFPYAFLEAFGNKETTIKRLRAGASNKSDLGGVLQTNNIHILASEGGQVTQMLAALKASPATGKAKAKFILATDGKYFEAEDLNSGQTVALKTFPITSVSFCHWQVSALFGRSAKTPLTSVLLAV